MATPLYPKTTPGRSPLRVGVLLDGWTVPRWISDVLSGVVSSGVAEVITVILNGETPETRAASAEQLQQVLAGRAASPGTLLWRMFVRRDARLHPEFVEPFELVDVHPLLKDSRQIDLVPVREGGPVRIPAASIAEIKSERLDLIVSFGLHSIPKDLPSATTYGVWTYQHSDHSEFTGEVPGFWEMYEGNHVTGTVLLALTKESPRAQVIYRSWGATLSFESLIANRYWHFRKGIPFVARCLRRVYEHRPAGLSPETEAPPDTKRRHGIPRNSQMLRFMIRTARKAFIARIKKRLGIEREHWFLGVARGATPGHDLSGKVTALRPPSGRCWADPMIVRRNEKSFLFFEDYEYSSQLGQISVAEIDADGLVGAPRTVLQEDYHLSYPFLFEWRGEHYMIPETASVHAVRLYRATEFPTRWEYVQDLLSGIRAADSTIFEHGELWYLFTSVTESGGSSWDELFLFVADLPTGPWAPHAMNPIVSDVRCARPGGPLFRRNGKIYRPAQNSEKSYGHSLSVLEVTELTPDRYAEQLAYRIEPDWLPGIEGCHTISMAGDLIALDCKTSIRRR